MTARLRLLAIIEAHSITGPAKNLLDFARLAANQGVETTFATFTRNASTNLFIETARLRGISVETIPERGAYDPSVAAAIGKLVERHQPDIVQTHAVKSHFLARRAGVPHLAAWVAFHHGYTWPSLRARIYNQLDRWSLRAAHQILTVSLPFRDELVGRGVDRERIEIVHNAIPQGWGTRDLGSSGALRACLGIAPDRKVILIVGRLSREKDHETLLESLRGLDPSLMPHLLIVGEGPERKRIEDRIRNLNLGPFVTLTGQQDSAEPYYGIADAAILSSRTEGSPNALLEAMAAGVPVVATRVGGIPEIVTDNQSALLVNPGSSSAMGAAINRLLNDPDLAQRLTERAGELIREKHAPQARVDKLIEVYRRVLRQSVK